MVRQNAAILQEAESDLVAKINNWFDQTMDRTSQRFTASTRAITFAAGFVVAFGLQVDTAALVNRLAADDQLRDAFVREAETLYAAAGGGGCNSLSSERTGGGRGTSADPLSQEEIDRKYRSLPGGERRHHPAGPGAVVARLGHREPVRAAGDRAAAQPGRAILVQRARATAAASIRHRREGRCAADGAAVDGVAHRSARPQGCPAMVGSVRFGLEPVKKSL